ncbi:hypothetical protein IWX90DRAFT_389710 [Phyllosticta citrichinensis]|uniref:Uncharacterized protein n=1 Tax=Phyllosticta citrichinensis TaxID=1130410 RepID=A0ABR1XLS8_9PEZI
MPPDLNSLPPSRSPSVSISTPATTNMSSPSPSQQAPSPTGPAHHAPHSIQVAAMLNANEERRSSSSSQRNSNPAARRPSSVRMQLNLMDPNLPQPSEIQMSPSLHSHRPSWPTSPHHQRAPSLGEIHQELESEQEAQVNRLLHMIRRQQAELAALRSNEPSAIDDSTPSSERSLSLPQSATASQSNVSQIAPPRPRSPLPGQGSLSRNSSHRRSRNSSRTGSPALRPTSHHSESGDWQLGAAGNRDESAFYQAETQMLTRENQMLKMRIRELERQLHDLNPMSPITQAPVTTSNLSSPPLRPEDEPSTLRLDNRMPPVTLGEAGAASSAATSAL